MTIIVKSSGTLFPYNECFRSKESRTQDNELLKTMNVLEAKNQEL